MSLVKKPRIIAIVGPTSSGKSNLAVELSKKINGEVISVDSRQVYKGMNLGTGKITKKEMKGVTHWGLDLVSPRSQYSVAQFQDYAKKTIFKILAEGKVPILCGGTAHWMDAVVYDQIFPQVKPNLKLRKQLEKKTNTQLYKQLLRLDPSRATNIDSSNTRRLIRALEIVITTKKPVPELKQQSPYEITWIGLKPQPDILQNKIHTRLQERIKKGMIQEVKKLHTNGVSWKRLENFGLEYKYCALFLQKKLTKKELTEQLFKAILQYSKRQMTWWKRNKNITWYSDSTELRTNH